MMKFFRKIHLWLSVPFGIFVTLICFSGAMLIFEPEITRSVRSDVYYVAAAEGEPKPLDSLMETVAASLPDSVSVTGVTVFSDPERAYQVNLSKPKRASVFIDQYTGEITGSYERLGFFSTMFKMHRWLLDSANPHGDGIKVGKLLVGISTLVFVIALLTGVVIWWPRARKNLKRSLSIPFSDGWRGLWKGLHVAGGMYALILVLAMALTGLTWSFDWYRTAFYAVCGVEHTPREMSSPKAVASGNARNSGEGRPERNGEGRPERSGEGRPERSGEGRPERSGEGRPERNGEGRPERNGEGRPEHNGEGRPEHNGEGRPERSGEGRPERSGEGRPERSGEGHPERNGEGRPERSGEGRHGRHATAVAELQDTDSTASEAVISTENAAETIDANEMEAAKPTVSETPVHARKTAAAKEVAATGSKAKSANEPKAETVSEETASLTAQDVREPEILSPFMGWQTAYSALKAMNPGAPQISISPEQGTVTLGTTGNGRASDRYSFDPATGTVTQSRMYSEASEADRLRGWIYSIHTGSLGGLTTRILWLLAALLGASLPLTGYYIWIRRMGKKKPHTHR